MITRITTMMLLGLVLVQGCKSGDEKAEGAGAARSAGLEMASDSAICQKAMKCCEKRVELEKGKATIEDINLMCSGVALAKTDAECDQFRQGWVAAAEASGKTVPAECK
jgi:hypothetical protein